MSAATRTTAPTGSGDRPPALLVTADGSVFFGREMHYYGYDYAVQATQTNITEG